MQIGYSIEGFCELSFFQNMTVENPLWEDSMQCGCYTCQASKVPSQEEPFQTHSESNGPQHFMSLKSAMDYARVNPDVSVVSFCLPNGESVKLTRATINCGGSGLAGVWCYTP